MSGKKAIVTGGSRDIGFEIVKKLASEGYDIAFSYHTAFQYPSAEEEAAAYAREIETVYGVKCWCHHDCLYRKGIPAEMFQKAAEALGGVDLLVCSTGLAFDGSIMELDEDAFDRVICLDYKYCLLMTQCAEKYMVEKGIRGSIVLVTSDHSMRIGSDDAVYGSLSAGLNRAVESLACEFGNYGIRINAVASDGDADISDTVSYLASDEARYITGTTFRVGDGGRIQENLEDGIHVPEGQKKECKKAIVVGGSRGIGRSIARQLAAAGYDVAFSYNSAEEEAKELAEEIRDQYGTACYYHQASMQKKEVPRQFFEAATADLGEVGVLVYVAGATIFGSFLELDEGEMDSLVNMNYRNCLLMISYVSNHMAEHGNGGSIVYISTVHSLRAYPFNTIYGATKACLNRAVRSMASELGSYGIRINCIAPGCITVRTFEEAPKDPGLLEPGGHIYPLGRRGYPKDISNAAMFLVSEDARYISGVTVPVEGGMALPGMPESVDPKDHVRVWGFKEHYETNVHRKGEYEA